MAENNWAKWDAEHGRGGGARSADKLAESIKAAMGHTGPPAVPVHGSHGSVVHKTTKKDLKRPAPVKGEKDRADSMRTQIRMAAYQRKKAEALQQDPLAKTTPKVEQKVNPHEPKPVRSADRLAAARDQRAAGKAAVDRRKYETAARAADKASLNREAAGLHARVAKTVKDPQAKAYHQAEAAKHAGQSGDYKKLASAATRLSIKASQSRSPEDLRAAIAAHKAALPLATTSAQHDTHDLNIRMHEKRLAEATGAAPTTTTGTGVAQSRFAAAAKDTTGSKELNVRVASHQAARDADSRAYKSGQAQDHELASEAWTRAATKYRDAGHTGSAYEYQRNANRHYEHSVAGGQIGTNRKQEPSAQALSKARRIVSKDGLTPQEHEAVAREVAKHVDRMPAAATDRLEVHVTGPLTSQHAGHTAKASTQYAPVTGRAVMRIDRAAIGRGAQDQGTVHGFSVTGKRSDLEDVVAHEMGHVLHGYIGRKQGDQIVQPHALPSRYASYSNAEHLAEAYAHGYHSGNSILSDKLIRAAQQRAGGRK